MHICPPLPRHFTKVIMFYSLLIYSSTSFTKFSKYKKGHYILQDLRDAKEDIRQGKTYSEATANRNVSRSTLHSQ